MNLTEIPYGLTSQVYRTTMPFGIAKNPEIIGDLKVKKISDIVLLCPAYESEFCTQTDLKSLYESYQFKVIHFPILDRDVPDITDLRKLIQSLYDNLSSNDHNNTVVHCLGGNGRTGLILACLARKVFNCNYLEAIDFIRQYVPGAVETAQQREMINLFSDPILAQKKAAPKDSSTHDQKLREKAVKEKQATPGISSNQKKQPAPVQASSSSRIQQEQKLVEIPFELPSKVFQSAIPHDIKTNPKIIENLKNHQIKTVVMLCTNKEAELATRTNLKEFYEQNQLQVLHLPIEDGRIPSMNTFKELLNLCHGILQREDQNILVHCKSGTGRTGLFMACLARKLSKKAASEAIAWVREFIPRAAESLMQQRFVEQIEF